MCFTTMTWIFAFRLLCRFWHYRTVFRSEKMVQYSVPRVKDAKIRYSAGGASSPTLSADDAGRSRSRAGRGSTDESRRYTLCR